MDALPLQQHPRFAEALRRMGQTADVMDLGASGQALAVRRRLPLLGEVAYLPRGPVWATEDPDMQAEVLTRLGRQRVRLIEAEAPCPSLRHAGFRQVVTPAHVAELDLTGTPEARRRRLDLKWRGHLNQAERSGLRIAWERFDGDPGHWLLAQEAAMRRDRRYRVLPPSVACAFARTAPDAARLAVALEDGQPVAGMLFLLHPPVATYQIGWTGDRGRRISAHHRLLMAAADRFGAEGFARLDLGTVDTEANPGLARFKIGAGARVRALGGSWVRLPFARARD